MGKLVERLLVCTFDDFRQSNLLFSVFSLTSWNVYNYHMSMQCGKFGMIKRFHELVI